MSIVGVTVTFVVVWWLVFFIVLPIGVKMEDKPAEGHASSAPKNPNIGKKMIITTLITLVITAGYFFLLEHGYFDFIQVR